VDRRQGDVPAGVPRVAIALPEAVRPWPEPEQDERRVVEPEDGLRRLVEAALTAQASEEEDDPSLRRESGGRADEVGARLRRGPARLAVEKDGGPDVQ
jgi:hypothetical protein